MGRRDNETETRRRGNVPVVRAACFDSFHVFLARDHLAEDGVLAVEVRRGHGGDEELRAVAVYCGSGQSVALREGSWTEQKEGGGLTCLVLSSPSWTKARCGSQ